MIKVIRDNEKKVVAIVGVLLMISFVAVGRSGSGSGAGRNDVAVGSVAGGKPLMASEVNAIGQEVQAVEHYTRRSMYGGASGLGGQQISLVGALLGEMAPLVTQRPEVLALLRREAAAAGIVPDPARAQSTMDEWFSAGGGAGVELPAADTDEYALIHNGVTDLYTVVDNFNRVAAALKTSQPAVEHALASVGQTVQLNLVPVDADALAATVPPPTPAQLDEQFKKYAAVAADRADPATDPLGFGYRQPVRTTMQYVRLPHAAVEQAVAATKSDYEWKVAALKVYYAHPEQFAAEGATTRPAGGPPTDAVRDQALHQIRDPLVQSLQDQVQQYLVATLAQEAAAYTAAAKDGKPAPATSLGQPYDRFDYLRSLAAAVQSKFKVHVDVDELKGLSTTKDVPALPGFGRASVGAGGSTSANSDGRLPEYVMDRASAYLAATKTAGPTPAVMADLLQPSPAFVEATGDAIDIIRLASIQPDAPAANLDAVRPAVEADCRTAAAYERAKADADQLATAARAGKLADAAKAGGRTVLLTQPLTSRDVSIDGLRPPLGDAAPEFMRQAFALLSHYDPAKDAHPVVVIATPAQRRLFVAQLWSVTWTGGEHYQARLEAAAALRQQLAGRARINWFSPSAVISRTGFKSSRSTSAETP